MEEDNNTTNTKLFLNKLKLFIDADDTILNSSQVIIEIINKKYNLHKTIEDLKDWSYKSIYKKMTIEEVEQIYNSQEFFDKVEFQEGFLEFYNKFKSNIDIFIITKGYEQNLIYKKFFFKKYLPKVKFIGLSFNQDKTFDKSSINMLNGIQIDDRADCLQTNADIKILYRNKPETYYNKININQENFYLCTTWNEISKIIDFSLNNNWFLNNLENK